MTEQRKPLLQLRKLKKHFPVDRNRVLKAVEDVSFTVYEGEKFGVVGESGCGKSTLGRTILQLYEASGGSCVYYGKSIQELNPRYIQDEIDKLKDYQKKAGDYYQKSLAVDAEAEKLRAQTADLDPDGNKSDEAKYIRLRKEIAKKEFESKELRKDASRQLREGSRTVGSLILCKDIDKIAELFTKAENEVRTVHQTVLKHNKIVNQIEQNEVLLDQKANVDKWIQDLEAKGSLNDQEEFELADLKAIKKNTASLDTAKLQAEIEALKPQAEQLKAEIEEHGRIEMGYRNEAFEKYRGKDILPLTELTMDPAYQAKLDRNYETGINLGKLTKQEMRSIRPDLQMVFQDPAASLDPRQSVGKAVEEVLQIHTRMSRDLRREKTLSLLHQVDLKAEHYYSYPNSLSGGMKQRVGIARAIALDPSFIVLDEAVSALDVSVQAQILQLLNRLQEEKNLTYLFITHDLGVVKHFCDRVMVMYLGRVCELSSCDDLFKKPLHPYTQSLLDAVPRMRLNQEENDDEILQGEVPSPINPPSGCPFHTRCRKCMDICKETMPKYREVEPGRFVACHLYDKEGNQNA
ncbi:MAG: ATP-binding cassette domain-containing protein [Solobacterium sp.]|nr:ATP-binding cassette domain-containing protein [Solobacterium sp.]